MKDHATQLKDHNNQLKDHDTRLHYQQGQTTRQNTRLNDHGPRLSQIKGQVRSLCAADREVARSLRALNAKYTTEGQVVNTQMRDHSTQLKDHDTRLNSQRGQITRLKSLQDGTSEHGPRLVHIEGQIRSLCAVDE